MQKDFFFEVDGFSVDEQTGERFPAGVKTTVEDADDLTDEQVLKMLADRFDISEDRLHIISEEKYMEEYGNDGEDESWEE